MSPRRGYIPTPLRRIVNDNTPFLLPVIPSTASIGAAGKFWNKAHISTRRRWAAMKANRRWGGFLIAVGEQRGQ